MIPRPTLVATAHALRSAGLDSMVLSAGLRLVGDGPEMRLQVGHRLNGTDQLVDRPAQERCQLQDLVGFGRTISLRR
jgi:hypothetical protein